MAGSNSCKLLNEQLFSSPPTVSLENVHPGDASNRDIAPYALEATCPTHHKKRRFFQFAAVVCEVEDAVACLVFGLHENTLFAYAGHFLVTKEKILNPATRKPPDTLKTLPDSQGHQYTNLFGVLNRALTKYSNYFLHCPCLRYQDFLSESQDLFFSLIKESNIEAPNKTAEIKTEGSTSPPVEETFAIEEPRTTTVFYNTCFVIDEEMIKRISKHIQPMNAVKENLKELGRSHGQAFAGRSITQRSSAEVLGCDQFFDKENRTNYCAAYEEPGCMPFFESSLLLGKLDERYIVGVRASNSFAIIATSRVYERASGQLVKSLPDEVFQSLHLPKWISGDEALVLLITRQILLRPIKFRKQLHLIRKCFQFDDYIPEMAVCRTCKRKPAPKAQAERIRSGWTKELLDYNFSETFQNSMLEFPESPSSPDNPSMFCINIVRLWIQEVIRLIHGKELGDIQFNESLLVQFFGMTIAEFIDNYLPLYGLSPDCAFQCRLLDSHGVPGAVCCEKLPVNRIGSHVLLRHVTPLLDQRHMHFVPFVLLPPPYVALANSGDLAKLERCRSIVQTWANTPYIELLAKFRVPVCVDVDVENEDVSPRKRSARIESNKSNSDEARCSRSESDASLFNITSKKKRRNRKRKSFQMRMVCKIMKERNML